jgi:hypothetical protein
MHGTYTKIAQEMHCVYCEVSTESSNGTNLNFIDLSVHTECSAISHLYIRFVGFPVSSSKC